MSTRLQRGYCCRAGYRSGSAYSGSVCRSTGMGFAAVARVTEQRCICCAVRDGSRSASPRRRARTSKPPSVTKSGRAARPSSSTASSTTWPIVVITRRRSTASRATSLCRSCSRTVRFLAHCARSIRVLARLNTPQTFFMFKLFAELISTHLDAANSVAVSEARSARRSGDLRTARAVHRSARP